MQDADNTCISDKANLFYILQAINPDFRLYKPYTMLQLDLEVYFPSETW